MRFVIAVAVLGFSFRDSIADDPPDPLEGKKVAWQKVLEANKFRFSESEANVLYSISSYNGDCKIHMVHDPKDLGRRKLTFWFEREGKDLVTLLGHTSSVFRTIGNVLYFADFHANRNGCKVCAHDLTTGKKLWETKLKGVGSVSHFGYDNEVTMDLSSMAKLDKEGEGVVSITGRESYGDYVEILDRATGKLLAHKVYRQGFSYSK